MRDETSNLFSGFLGICLYAPDTPGEILNEVL
jgi:hypothetical protein